MTEERQQAIRFTATCCLRGRVDSMDRAIQDAASILEKIDRQWPIEGDSEKVW
jgi:hypothetical protein